MDLSEQGRKYLSPSQSDDFILPDIGEVFHKLENSNLSSKEIALEIHWLSLFEGE